MITPLSLYMFDFQSYVQRRQANPSRIPVRIQNYAYIEDIEHLRQISEHDLIHQAVSLGLRAWQFAEGRKLKSKSKPIDESFERISKAWLETCFTFNHQSLLLKFIPTQRRLFESYGGQDGVFFGLSNDAVNLPSPSLKFLFGRGIGALDNGHVPYLTLSRFFDDMTRGLWNFAAQIPDALIHWRRSAEITEDRAGLLASRDISAAIMSMMRMNLDWDNAEIMREIRRYHEGLDVDWGDPEIEKRVKALEIFMKSCIYLRSGGLSMDETDAQVSQIFGIF